MRFSRLLGIIVAFSLVVCVTRPAHAQTTWVGTSGTALWDIGSNWGSGVAPAAGGTASFVFSGSTLLTSTNNIANLSASAILFPNNTAGAGGFVLSGSTVALRGNITTTALSTSGTVTDEIAFGLVLTDDNRQVTLSNGPTVQHNLIISGSIGEDGTPRTLSRFGNGSTLFLTNTNNTFSSLTSSGGGSISVSQLGMAGKPSQTGIGSVISLQGSILTYTGTGETSDKRLLVNTGTATFSNNGSGSLNLTGNNGLFNATSASAAAGVRGLTLSGANTGNNTISAAIVDVSGSTTISVAKAGSGKWILSGSNTYSAATSISAGTLQIGGGGTTGSLNTASSIAVSSGATLAFSRSNTMTQGTDFNSVLSGAGNVTQLGPGTLVLNGANTYTGTTTVTAGTLRFATQTSLYNNGTANWTAAKINVKSGATLALNVGGSGEFTQSDVTTLLTNLASSASAATGMNAGAILGFDTTNASTPFEITTAIANTTGASGGARGLVKLGSGTLTLSGNNSYSGGATISSGQLTLGHSNALGTGTTTVSNGVLAIGSFAPSVSGFTISSGSLTGSGTLSAATYGLGGGTVSANLGSGTATVTGASTLAGTSGATALNLNAGVLALGSGSRFTSASIAVTGSSGAGLTLGGNESFGSLAGEANVALGGSTLSVGSANTSTTYSGVLSGAGGLTKAGSGVFALANANTYTGATTISSGTLIASVANAISGSSAITIGSVSSRGFLKVDDALTISSLTFTGSGGDIVDPSSGLVTFSSSTGTATVTVLSGSNKFHANATLASPTLVDVSNGAYFSFHNNLAGGGSLTKSGSGTMNLTGDNDTLSGNLFITGGLMTVGPGMNQIGSGTTTLSNGSTIDLNGNSFTDRIVVLNGTILNAGGTATTTTIAGISTIGGTTAQGTYNITSTGSALFNVAVGDGAAAVNVSVNNGGGSGGLATFAQAIGTNGNVTVLGGGAATFNSTVGGYVISHGASTFNGNVLSGAEVQVNSGTAGTGSALFAANVASTVTVQSDAAAEFRGLVSGPTTISGSALFTSASGLSGSLDTNPGGVATLDNVAAAITGSIHNDGLVTVNRTSGSQTISGLISGTGSLVKQGAGLLTLTGSNTFAGLATISGGTLSVGNGGTSGALAGNVVNDAALIFNRSDDLTYAGNISGSGGLTKLGVGKLIFTGSSSYGGITTVSNGTLAINGQIASSAAVASGATLGGSGVIGGVLSGAGLVSPGNSPGILTASQFNPTGGLDAAFELTGLSPIYNAPTASGNDILRLTSGTPFTTGLGGGNELNFYFNMDSLGGGTYEAGFFTILSAGELLTALQSAAVNFWIKDAGGSQPFNGSTYSLYSGVTLSTATVTRNFGAGDVTGSVTQLIIVPEPESIILACGGIAVAVWAARRRRS